MHHVFKIICQFFLGEGSSPSGEISERNKHCINLMVFGECVYLAASDFILVAHQFYIKRIRKQLF